MSSRKTNYPIKLLFLGIAAVFFSPSQVRANILVVNPLFVESSTGTVADSSILVPILFGEDTDDKPESGFYHQSILLQKSTDNYFKSKRSDKFEQNDVDVYDYKDQEFD